MVLSATTGHHSKDADDSHKQTEETKVLYVESPQLPNKLEREKHRGAVVSAITSQEGSRFEPRPTQCLSVQSLHILQSNVHELQSNFNAYEQTQMQVEHILQNWDLAQGLLLVPLPNEEIPLVLSEGSSTDKQSPVNRRIKKANNKTLSPEPSPTTAPAEADKGGDGMSPQNIIPHIVVNVTGKDYRSATELLKGGILPSLNEVMDDLGLGSYCLPTPINFSVVPFPKPREQSDNQVICDRFTFLVPSGPYKQGEERKDSEEDAQAPVVKEERVAVASRSHGKGIIKEGAVTKDKDKKGRESEKNRNQTSAKTKAKGSDRSHSPLRDSTSSDGTEQHQHQGTLKLKRNQSVTTFRWIVPASGETILKIWFYSESPGKFEQTFNFELLGTQRHYQLNCKGFCTYPSICNDYSKNVPQKEEGLQKTYVVKPGYFEFGPLLCSKTRDRYKENRYPENTERLLIHNNSGLDAEIQFRFQHDTQATTYLLDPPKMTLKPDQKQELTVWAYPTKMGQVMDSVVCCIKNNPELVIISLSCWGVRPELELESKHLQFDKVLVHRRASRSVTLRNKTALPVSWRLQGVDELGDVFNVPQDQGIISPNSSSSLRVEFRATRQFHSKKSLRLEVSDVEKILGVVQTENIQVTAEAYDPALNILPADGCLDFGTIRVFEETKLSLKLTNPGKYATPYKFTLQRTDPAQPDLESIFTVSPQCGTLMPNDKYTTVQIICRPNTEVLITEQPILSCQVIDPTLEKGEETIGSICVSIQSVFSRYKIIPAYDINFGPLVYGCKTSHSFTIENTGVLETRFTVGMITDSTLLGRPG